MRRIVIVGGGAAGLMAAYYAAEAGASVTLLERNEKLGKKIYITGKGRCNVTNAAEKEAFMKQIVRNPRFMYASLSCLDNFGLMSLIESAGVPLKTERGERVFPESDKASDITFALERLVRKQGASVRLNTRVNGVTVENGHVSGVSTDSGIVPADAVILATGGLSYPSTGSTGDGMRFAEACGHSLTPTRPALTSIETVETWTADLSGLTLKNVKLTAYSSSGGKRKKLYSEQGEMLFTHFGISGPLVLTLSSMLPDDPAGTPLEIDLKPALDSAKLDLRVLRDFDSQKRRQLAYVLDGLAPHSLGLKIAELAGLSPFQPVHSVTSLNRKALVDTLKALPLTVKGLRGMNEAVITRGGVDVKNVNPSTLESKIVKNLFFAGEILDVDALTGGFNLQIAFSTGALAGKSAAAVDA